MRGTPITRKTDTKGKTMQHLAFCLTCNKYVPSNHYTFFASHKAG